MLRPRRSNEFLFDYLALQRMRQCERNPQS
jgi:hypothetical protein